MKVDTKTRREAVYNLFCNPNQVVALDANFFIPPDRMKEGAKSAVSFSQYKRIWLDPFFLSFPRLAIHEAVLNEIILDAQREYVEEKICSKKLVLLKDEELSMEESSIRNTKERLISVNTQYEPSRDNKDDRGEVKTLAYISTKGFLYFATNDQNAIRLVDQAGKLKTTLDELSIIKFYEGIFLLLKMNLVISSEIKWLYKYLYYITIRDKKIYQNPGWGDFCKAMSMLYPF